MPKKKFVKLPASVRCHIRKEKARLRALADDPAALKRQIADLYARCGVKLS
jgi:hypothetical protein